MNKLGPPPLDGLSEVSWARVERNVFSRIEGTITNASAAREIRPSRNRGSWLWLAFPAMGVAAFVLAFYSINDSAIAPSMLATDDEPSRIVASDAPSTVSFGDAHITLEAHSAIVTDQRANKATALLERGAAVFAVAPRGERAPFTVLAGD